MYNFNPYFYTIPTNLPTPKTGLFSRLFGGNIKFETIINGTQKALNLANQAIPLVKQVRPMIGNAKTMFKVMNEFKRNDKIINNNKINNDINNTTKTEKQLENSIVNKEDTVFDNIGPTFFI